MTRVIVAMSGGVDSSVAAARLVDQGLEVVGVTLHLWDYPDDGSVQGRCCAPEDLHDARRVAAELGIPHYSFDRRSLFREAIVAPFVDGYLAGETPSPCVRCNRTVKTGELLRLADRLGAQRVATGHYARTVDEGGQRWLLRGVDASKDQSYFLHMLPQDVLARLVFPLGASTKAEVRAEAVARGLAGAEKGESQELCFVPTGRYDDLIEKEAHARIRPGAIVDEQGRRVANHGGIHRFTVGQRRNLGVSLGHRSYVTALDADSATVHLGPRERLLATGAELDELSLAATTHLPLRAEIAVRYGGRTHPAEVLSVPAAGHVAATLSFDEPVAAVVPGQYAVFYCGERVLGGGRIRRALLSPDPGCA